MSSPSSMSKCPKCGQTVPDWAQVCQFCGTLMPGRDSTVRPRIPASQGGVRWTDIAYVIASAWWMLQGLRVILVGAKLLPESVGGPAAFVAPIIALCLAIGAFQALIGLGLLLKIEIARGIANVLCWLQILGCAIGILFGIFGTAFTGLQGLIGVLFSMLDLASALFMVYLLGETDAPRRA